MKKYRITETAHGTYVVGVNKGHKDSETGEIAWSPLWSAGNTPFASVEAAQNAIRRDVRNWQWFYNEQGEQILDD